MKTPGWPYSWLHHIEEPSGLQPVEVIQRSYSSWCIHYSKVESSAHHLTPARQSEELKDAVTVQEEWQDWMVSPEYTLSHLPTISSCKAMLRVKTLQQVLGCMPIYSTCQLQRKHRAPIFTPNQVTKRWKEIFWSQLEPYDGQQSILKDRECKLRPWFKWTRLFSFFCNPVVDSHPKCLSYDRLASKYELKHSCTICTRKSQIHQQGSCRASSRSFGMVWEWPNSEGEEEISETKS